MEITETRGPQGALEPLGQLVGRLGSRIAIRKGFLADDLAFWTDEGSLGYWLQKKLPVKVEVPTYTNLFACARDTTWRHHGKHENVPIRDHFVETKYPCMGGETQRALGRTLTTEAAGTVKLVQCYFPDRNEHLVAQAVCDTGTQYRGDLGYAYTAQVAGTIPFIRCTFNSNGEHYVLSDTTNCHPDSKRDNVWYILPPCTETDAGNFGSKGVTTSWVENKEYTDTCEGNELVEYSCDTMALPNAVKTSKMSCGMFNCVDGECKSVA